MGATLQAETSQIIVNNGSEPGYENSKDWHSKNYETTFGLASLEEIVKDNDEADQNIAVLTKK